MEAPTASGSHTTQVWSGLAVLLVQGCGCGCRMCWALVLLHPSGVPVVIVQREGRRYCAVNTPV